MIHVCVNSSINFKIIHTQIFTATFSHHFTQEVKVTRYTILFSLFTRQVLTHPGIAYVTSIVNMKEPSATQYTWNIKIETNLLVRYHGLVLVRMPMCVAYITITIDATATENTQLCSDSCSLFIFSSSV